MRCSAAAVGETGATMGTTRGGQAHTHVVEGVEGALLLTDTPGLGEAGPEGSGRELEAIDLATHADLLVFVVDHDLTRADCQTIFELARQGKRLIVALNKKDRFTEEDREADHGQASRAARGLRSGRGYRGRSPPPRPRSRSVPVSPTGRRRPCWKKNAPDLEELECRVAAVLEREGDALRAGNILLRARLREQAERDEIARQRRAAGRRRSSTATSGSRR